MTIRYMLDTDIASYVIRGTDKALNRRVVAHAGRLCMSAITYHEAIKELAENIGVNEFVILPSSIHECILMPKTAETDMDYLLSMVKEVNKTTVAPEERLIDAVFELTA